LHLALRNALWTLGELSQLFVHLQHAAALAETLGDTHRLGWVMVYLVIHFVGTGELDHALQYGQRALTMATTVEDRRLMVISQNYLGLVYRGLGDYPHAIECYRDNVACLHDVPLQERLGTAGLVSEPHRHLAGCLAECGAFAAGREPAEEGVRIAEIAGDPYGLALAYAGAGVLALRQGDLSQALPKFEWAFDLAAGRDIEIGAPWITSLLGSAYTLAGRITEALPLLERAVTQAAARHFMFDYSRLAISLGEAYLCAGRLDEASAQAQRALEFARAHQERSQIAYALRLLGAIAVQREPPDHARAEAHYRQALALAEELGMCPLQAHCHRELGTVYSQIGRRAEACTALATARTMYRTMEMLFWLPQTEAALMEVGGVGT
jgi:tetratricopeptide (TPR) repeat protein